MIVASEAAALVGPVVARANGPAAIASLWSPIFGDMSLDAIWAALKVVIEVMTFAALIYIVLRFLLETRGSGIIRGLALLLLVGVAAFVILIDTLELDRLSWLVTATAPSVVLGLVIVFHPEIRRAIVHLGDAPIFGRFFRPDTKIVPRLLRAVSRMSKDHVGALIAIEREASLSELTANGITIDAELNSYLIESIFFPKSALHDGGVVVRDDRIVAASCLFPLSQNPDVDKRLGTRHRAALGLSEETDALVLVVSEETGKISIARGGTLSFDLTLEQLEQHLEGMLGRKQAS
ncbi:MAG TPA: diadenylate cyclase CdaA [Planctomycetota bacterium]